MFFARAEGDIDTPALRWYTSPRKKGCSVGYRLLAADYDLTLSGYDRTVSPAVREAIRAAFDAGKTVTLATGRLSDGAERARELFPADVPLVLCNGGLIQRCATGEILAESVMEPSAAAAAMEWCARYAGSCIVWCRDGLYADRMNEAADIYARLSFTSPAPLPDRDRAAASGVHKLLLLAEAPTIERAREEFALPLTAFPSSPEVLELVPPGVDKGAGLALAAKLLGVPRQEVIAVGDGENDIPMLRWAGLGAAMGNAPDSVKAAADIVIPSCEEDGAAWLINNYLL